MLSCDWKLQMLYDIRVNLGQCSNLLSDGPKRLSGQKFHSAGAQTMKASMFMTSARRFHRASVTVVTAKAMIHRGMSMTMMQMPR